MLVFPYADPKRRTLAFSLMHLPTQRVWSAASADFVAPAPAPNPAPETPPAGSPGDTVFPLLKCTGTHWDEIQVAFLPHFRTALDPAEIVAFVHDSLSLDPGPIDQFQFAPIERAQAWKISVTPAGAGG